MLFSKDITTLHDDGFEGSTDEHRIFKEVFFGDSSGKSTRFLVTGAINFERGDTKQTDTFLRSDSENSGVTSSSKTKEDYNQQPQPGCDTEDLISSRRSNQDAKVSESNINTLAPFEGVGLGTSEKVSSSCQTVACHLVESSTVGITSSYYLLKRHFELERDHEIGDDDLSKGRICSLDGNDQKEALCNVIASPVSQESNVTKLLVASPSIPVTNNPYMLRSAKPKWKDSCFMKLDEEELLLGRDSTNDPRSLLRYHTNRLFVAAGWVIGRRKRRDKSHGIGELVYKTPEGRPIREFDRAWTLCGESLYTYANNSVQEYNCKQWTGMAEFLSDLSTTVVEIEHKLDNLETTDILARLWSLLDPFAKVVFIDKTLRSLKDGKCVKASVSGKSAKCNIGSLKNPKILGNRKNPGIVGNQLTGRPEKELCESSLVMEGALTIHERDHWTSEQTSNCLIDVPISSGNTQGMMERFETVSVDQDSNISSPIFHEDTHDNVEGFSSGAVEHTSMDFHEKVGKTSGTKFSGQLGITFEGSASVVSNCEEDGHTGSKPQNTMNNILSNSEIKELTGKTPKKSKRILQIKLGSPHLPGKFDMSTSYEIELHEDGGNGISLNSKSRECSGNDVTKMLKRKKADKHDEVHQKKSKTSCLKDDDLLISAIIRNKTSKSTKKRSVSKSRTLKKQKSQKGGGCRLLPRSLSKGGKNLMEEKWPVFASRTVLSWLLHCGAVFLNEVIQYRDLKDDTVVKDGMVTRDGILCRCCHKVLSISDFKSHAGFILNRPCLNLFMESGKPFTLCQLEAWSAEYKARKGIPQMVQTDDLDNNDDSCGRCGDGGELICCDNCPSTFHQACMHMQELPEGSWYCPYCTCGICGDVVYDADSSRSCGAVKCLQCEHKYHGPCLAENVGSSTEIPDSWFCGKSCLKVYSGLQARIGLTNILPGGFSWMILRCIHGDQKVHSTQQFVALKAESNSKLAVALTIMEECFLPMVDPKTGIDMIPQVLYNWGSEYARLNYHGFHTVVLEKDDIVISVASIRIHGVTVAEMPLIATCGKYRRQGMCRRLMNSIEEMLKSLNVEKLVISAIPGLVETWTVGFGFEPLEESERRALRNINMMVFPGTVWLKKHLCGPDETDQQMATESNHSTIKEQEQTEGDYLAAEAAQPCEKQPYTLEETAADVDEGHCHGKGPRIEPRLAGDQQQSAHEAAKGSGIRQTESGNPKDQSVGDYSSQMKAPPSNEVASSLEGRQDEIVTVNGVASQEFCNKNNYCPGEQSQRPLVLQGN